MTAGPVSAESRIELLDALRGFALAGVLFINLRLFSQFDMLGEAQQDVMGATDQILLLMAQAFGDGKFVSLFSMLFGYGFALQIQRLEARGAPAMKLFLRRLVALFAIGVVHSLVWWGDILRNYALMGVVLLITRHWPARRLAWAGLLLSAGFIVVPTVTLQTTEAEANRRALEAFLSPSLAAAFRGNIAYDWFQFTRFPWVLPFILSRFFLGAAAGKAGLLADPVGHKSTLIRLSIAGAVGGVIATVLVAIADGSGHPWFVEDARGFNLLIGLQTLGLAVAYACWFALLFLNPAAHRVLRLLAPVGRMCLSNYLAQTLICVVVFYGIGFGIGPDYGMRAVYVAWAILFGAQMIISPVWLRYFHFGPAEWLWRSLTYGSLQPFRR